MQKKILIQKVDCCHYKLHVCKSLKLSICKHLAMRVKKEKHKNIISAIKDFGHILCTYIGSDWLYTFILAKTKTSNSGYHTQINPFPPKGSPLMSNIQLSLALDKQTKWPVWAGLGEEGLKKL